MSQKLKIWMGWDPNETKAYDVARGSILKRASNPKLVQIMPLQLPHLAELKLLTRPVERRENGQLWCPISDAPMSTEFANSRFCVPFLQHSGWGLFCDCDIVCLDDISKLFSLAEDKYAVMVVKHNQTVECAEKKEGKLQSAYSRKNWSSVVLWNCSHPSNKALTAEHLNTWPGRDLHAFKWLKDEEIGELPLEWNWLANVSPSNGSLPKLVHYTLGGPWIKGWKPHQFDEIWLAEAKEMGLKFE